MSELDLTNPEQFQQALAEAAELDVAGDAGGESADDSAPTEEVTEEAAPVEEAVDDSADDVDVVTTDKGKMIPYGRAKEMTTRAQEANDRAIRAETQLRTILDAMNAKEERERAPAKQEVEFRINPYDKDTQPVEFLEEETRQLRAEIQAERAERQRDRQQQSTMTQAQQMLASAGADLNKAEAEGVIPDANDRARYLIDAKAAEISLFARNEQEFTQALDNYKLALIGAAHKQGKSVAEVTKVLSDSMGYALKAKAAASATPPRTISAIAANKAKSASVSNGAGAQLNGAPTNIDAVMNKNGRGVNPAEFHKMLKNLQG
jgi:hypothetical protein